MSKNGQSKYGHVGRPTNEEISERKRKVLIKISCIVILVLIITITFSCFISGVFNKNLLASTSNFKFQRIFKMSTNNLNSNALQGSTGYGNRIYFSTSKSGSRNQKNYYSNIKFYDLGTKKVYTIKDFDKLLSKMSTYKVNDIATNTNVGRNYYLLVDEINRNNSKIIFSTNKIERELTLDRVLTNIAYNANDKKYYSLVYNNIYSFNLPSSVPKSNINQNLGNVSSSLVCNIEGRKGISSQGITINDNFLLHSFQKALNDNVYANYIDVYNVEDCKKSNKIIKPFKTLNLGKCKLKSGVNNCIVGSLFYMNSKLYVGYNNSSFNGISFYNVDITINDTNTTTKTNASTTTKTNASTTTKASPSTTTKAQKTTTSDYKATGYLGNPLNPKDTKRNFLRVMSAKCFPRYCLSRKAHSGFDLNSLNGARKGKAVYAMDSGVVTFAGTYSGNCYKTGCKNGGAEGLGVIIDHGNGYKTAYYHFSKRIVQSGQKVKKGQKIGYVGNTGKSSGPHVHISLINKSLYEQKCGSKFSCAKGYDSKGFMNAAKYINKNVSYVGKKN